MHHKDTEMAAFLNTARSTPCKNLNDLAEKKVITRRNSPADLPWRSSVYKLIYRST